MVYHSFQDHLTVLPFLIDEKKKEMESSKVWTNVRQERKEMTNSPKKADKSTYTN